MSCHTSDEVQLKVVHTFLAAVGLGVIIAFVLSLPELKRYLKISNM
jgi:energy-converting hydrogenase Eha subunit A